jgi:hypothetical protein
MSIVSHAQVSITAIIVNSLQLVNTLPLLNKICASMNAKIGNKAG